MLKQLPEGVIIVSGTNGKTTTTKIITELLAARGKRVLTNRTGGNFVRGVFSTIVQAASPSGRLAYDVAVYEQDEAYAARFVKLHRPRAAVLLNVTRDQLDRFGEIDTTAALLQKVADRTSEVVVVNDDDLRLNKMTVSGDAKLVYFGISDLLQPQFPNDEQFYGAFRQELAKHRRQVQLNSVGENTAEYQINSKNYSLKLVLDGQHNALNGAAAIATVSALYPKVLIKDWSNALAAIKPAFGRGELIEIDGRTLILQLIKNPATFPQPLHLLHIHKPQAVGIVINDNHADGRDVSWLWDIDFVPLSNLPIITSGIRGYDMANRLKYDDIKVQAVEADLKKLVQQLAKTTASGQTAIIFATYTAMLATRKTIGRLTRVEKV